LHTLKNLAMALTGYVGDLGELFQCSSPKQSSGIAKHSMAMQTLSDELAEVLL
jgi:hypothetical protein